MNEHDDNKYQRAAFYDGLPASHVIKNNTTQQENTPVYLHHYSQRLQQSFIGNSVLFFMIFLLIANIILACVYDKFNLDILFFISLLICTAIRQGDRDAAKWMLWYIPFLIATFTVYMIFMLFNTAGLITNPQWQDTMPEGNYSWAVSVIAIIWGLINLKYLYQILKITHTEMNITEKPLYWRIVIPVVFVIGIFSLSFIPGLAAQDDNLYPNGSTSVKVSLNLQTYAISVSGFKTDNNESTSAWVTRNVNGHKYIGMQIYYTDNHQKTHSIVVCSRHIEQLPDNNSSNKTNINPAIQHTATNERYEIYVDSNIPFQLSLREFFSGELYNKTSHKKLTPIENHLYKLPAGKYILQAVTF